MGECHSHVRMYIRIASYRPLFSPLSPPLSLCVCVCTYVFVFPAPAPLLTRSTLPFPSLLTCQCHMAHSHPPMHISQANQDGKPTHPHPQTHVSLHTQSGIATHPPQRPCHEAGSPPPGKKTQKSKKRRQRVSLLYINMK